MSREVLWRTPGNPCRQTFMTKFKLSLEWRHNGRDGVPNHQPHNCLLNGLFRRKSKKTSRLRVTGLCAGKSPVTGEFPAQMASNAENVSVWWRHMMCWSWLFIFSSIIQFRFKSQFHWSIIYEFQSIIHVCKLAKPASTYKGACLVMHSGTLVCADYLAWCG